MGAIVISEDTSFQATATTMELNVECTIFKEYGKMLSLNPTVQHLACIDRF